MVEPLDIIPEMYEPWAAVATPRFPLSLRERSSPFAARKETHSEAWALRRNFSRSEKRLFFAERKGSTLLRRPFPHRSGGKGVVRPGVLRIFHAEFLANLRV